MPQTTWHMKGYFPYPQFRILLGFPLGASSLPCPFEHVWLKVVHYHFPSWDWWYEGVSYDSYDSLPFVITARTLRLNTTHCLTTWGGLPVSHDMENMFFFAITGLAFFRSHGPTHLYCYSIIGHLTRSSIRLTQLWLYCYKLRCSNGISIF